MMTPPNRRCVDCGTAFYDRKSQRKFCGDCNPNGGENNGNWQDAKETARCRFCDVAFEYYPSNKQGIYCSECVADADGLLPENPSTRIERVAVRCRTCGAECSVLPSRLDENKRGFFCDQRCYGEWLSENIVGENHHQWQGGEIPYGRSWWRIRRQALERDDHRCQRCGITAQELGKEPNVHHIDSVRQFADPEDAHSLTNVISLCRPCRRLVEAGNVNVEPLSSGR